VEFAIFGTIVVVLLFFLLIVRLVFLRIW